MSGFGASNGVTTGEPRASAERLLELMMEYLGNLDETPGRRSDAERRRNLEARILVDRIMADLGRRGVPMIERERILEHLRDSIRPGSPGPVE